MTGNEMKIVCIISFLAVSQAILMGKKNENQQREKIKNRNNDIYSRKKIKDRYIVIFDGKQGSEVKLVQDVESKKQKLCKNNWKSKICGPNEKIDLLNGEIAYFIGYDREQVWQLESMAGVISIEEDFSIDYMGVISKFDKMMTFAVEDSSDLWNHKRISSRENNYKMQDLKFGNKGYLGVDVYLLDTVLRVSESEYEGRIEVPEDFEHIVSDLHSGHGTHCAGIIGSKSFGVSKSAKIISLGVIKSDNLTSLYVLVKGLKYVLERHIRQKDTPDHKGSVVNLSVGVVKSHILNYVIVKLVNSGIIVVTAAGNSHSDACNYSPGSAFKVINVASINKRNEFSNFSNFGPCVDILAPGERIISFYSNDIKAYSSGTSVAAPHVTGIVANYLSEFPRKNSMFHHDYTITQFTKMLIDYSSEINISNLPLETTNKVIYSGNGDYTLFWNT